MDLSILRSPESKKCLLERCLPVVHRLYSTTVQISGQIYTNVVRYIFIYFLENLGVLMILIKCNLYGSIEIVLVVISPKILVHELAVEKKKSPWGYYKRYNFLKSAPPFLFQFYWNVEINKPNSCEKLPVKIYSDSGIIEIKTLKKSLKKG